MTEKTQSSSGGQVNQTAQLQAGLIDVLMRGLAVARRNMEEGDKAEPRDFCALLYAEPGTLCPLAYYHRPE